MLLSHAGLVVCIGRQLSGNLLYLKRKVASKSSWCIVFINMKQKITYVHTNLISKDWKKLAEFYIRVFGCTPQYPERDLSGDWIDRLTRIKDVAVKGIHLQLPGYTDHGPTLEIFEYNKKEDYPEFKKINNSGFGHIAFRVDEVDAVCAKVIEHGGQEYGEIVKTEIEGLGTITVVYVKDPEGNIIELQNWKK
jgi:predicted enzyme related to lactoylglutathione lyase